ncbi:hypothetical protein GOP47_0020684 [Adiantum capillus-veneris]|uniref:SHSP domain-containing protein n=1 Tax=Adiantum capillus-veneris TaxID=13818 RepID=A0A9D4Z773_ADICA|nr:hypothetical protein GOP47_0020684 [Adiantum capillus-veneris]
MDPFPFSSSSLMRAAFPSFPDQHPSFARDVAAVANTQVDWKETPDSHIFKANLPGLAKEDVKVHVEDGHVLQITGERKQEETSSGDRWHRVERSRGSFLRRFRLPENAKAEEVKAGMENGVLTITIPKVALPEPKSNIRTIDISSS